MEIPPVQPGENGVNNSKILSTYFMNDPLGTCPIDYVYSKEVPAYLH